MWSIKKYQDKCRENVIDGVNESANILCDLITHLSNVENKHLNLVGRGEKGSNQGK